MITIIETRKALNTTAVSLLAILTLTLFLPNRINSTRAAINYETFIEEEPTEVYVTKAAIVEHKAKATPKISLYQSCIWFLKTSEGLHLNQYYCPANRLTIGWGHWIKDGEKFGTLTVAEADELFKQDFQSNWDYVNNRYPHFDAEYTWAITLFVFNVGKDNLKGSKLDRYLKESRYEDAARQIRKFNKARRHKKTCSRSCKKCKLEVFGGLTKKRKFEAALLLKDYDYIATTTDESQASVLIKIQKALKEIE